MGIVITNTPIFKELASFEDKFSLARFCYGDEDSSPKLPKLVSLGGTFNDANRHKVRMQFNATQEASRSLHYSYVQRIEEWLDKRIAAPNKELGRKGDVCPFVRPSLERNGIHIFLSLVISPDDTERVKEEVRSLLELLTVLSPVDPKLSKFKAALIVFPNLDESSATKMVLNIQRELKSEVVKLGQMIGEFYPGCEEPGLHNTDFRPLDSPMPFLAIREMDILDLPFLTSNPEHLRAYLDRFNIYSREQLDRAVKRVCPFELSDRFHKATELAFPET